MPKDDIVFRAMKDEMDRTLRKLRLGRLPKPYFVAYAVQGGAESSVNGSFGGVLDASAWPFRQARVILRVGGRAQDNSNFISRARGDCRPVTGDLPITDDYDAIRFALWSLTDQAYKQAVECYSAKEAYLKIKRIRHEADDFSREKPLRRFEPAPLASADMALWTGRVRELSSVFRNYPSIQSSDVSLSAVLRSVRYVNSEGGAYVQPASLLELVLSAKAQAPDGLELSDSRAFYGREWKDLPSMESLRAETDAFAREMSASVQASTMDAYVGPVLFEGQAAGEFFHHLLADQVSYARAPWQEDEDRKLFDTGALTGRLGLRVAAPSLSITDDPLPERHGQSPLFGHYRFDDEGVPAAAVRLVERGKLKDVLMSRAPTPKRPHSNGHGRGGFSAVPVGRVGTLWVQADRAVPEAELKNRLRAQCRELGLEYGLRIRRIYVEDRRDGAFLRAPTVISKVYVKDGREEPVRGLHFTGVSLRALKDILAVSQETYVHNFYQRGPFRDNMDYVPASIVTPSLLVQEVELKPTEEKPSKLPYLAHPYFEAAQTATP